MHQRVRVNRPELHFRFSSTYQVLSETGALILLGKYAHQRFKLHLPTTYPRTKDVDEGRAADSSAFFAISKLSRRPE